MSLDTESLQQDALAAVDAAATLDALEALRVQYLGKKGPIAQQMQQLGKLPPEERKEAGQALNRVKQSVAEAIAGRKQVLEDAALDARLREEVLDITLPCRPESAGSIHPITQVTEEVISIFSRMGFSVAEGPEIEDDFHNFTALNIPESHPARQMHDTFYLKAAEGETPKVLRTHTSPVQVRAMQAGEPPFRLIAPGRTFRCDSDMTHTPMFHQVEGLVIDEHIHMGHLKGCLSEFVDLFFAKTGIPLRFRSSFFPFTEPSAEMDVGCSREGGKLSVGEGDDWLEILGCGMVHPNVLKHCNLDPENWQGFAFGIGIDRLAMLKYGMPDLRAFFDSDLRWLRHYGFSPFKAPGAAGETL